MMKKLLVIGLLFLFTIGIASAYVIEASIGEEEQDASSYGCARGETHALADMPKNPWWITKYYALSAGVQLDLYDITEEEIDAAMISWSDYLQGYKECYNNAKSGQVSGVSTSTTSTAETTTTHSYLPSMRYDSIDWEQYDSAYDLGYDMGAADAQNARSKPYELQSKMNKIRGGSVLPEVRWLNANIDEYLKGYNDGQEATGKTYTYSSSTEDIYASREVAQDIGWAFGYTHGVTMDKKKNHLIYHYPDEIPLSLFHEDVLDMLPSDLNGRHISDKKAAYERGYRDGYAEGWSNRGNY